MAEQLLPFDPAGNNPECRIVDEQQILTAHNFKDIYFIVPRWAPFFASSLTLSFKNSDGSTRVLVEGIDYYLAHQFIDASKACAKPIYGSIEFLDKSIQGVIKLTYQSIGGTWTLDEQQIATLLADRLHNPRITAWEQVIELPIRFPVIDHEWDLVDMVGAKELVESLDDIREAITNNTGGGLSAHVANKSNPHEVTKLQVGLGNVQDYPIATTQQAQGGTNNTSYMTPVRTREAIIALGADAVAAHANRTDNPHIVTKAQVGLGNVPNYAMATSTEASAGTSNTTFMSPQLVAQVVAVVNSALQAHVNNHLNPHDTTKDQIQLNNVQNFAIATVTEAQQGQINTAYMTPLRTAQAIASQVSVSIQSHTQDFNNPHNTTKAQVGLDQVQNYGIATLAEASDSSIVNKYMTPQRVSQAIDALVKNDFIAHLNADNPHNVTKTTVGLGNVGNYPMATVSEAQLGTALDRYMSPATTKALADQVISTHVNDPNNPHNTTKLQVGLGNVENYGIATQQDAVDGTSNVLYMTPLRVAQYVDPKIVAGVNVHASRTDNPHNVTAAQVGAYTTAEVDQALTTKLNATATAVNSDRLENLTVAQVVAQATSGVSAQLDSFSNRIVTSGYLRSYIEDVDNLTPYMYVKLGTLAPMTNSPAVGEVSGAVTDLDWYMAGGEPLDALYGSVFFVSASIRDTGATNPPIRLSAQALTKDFDPNLRIGYVYDSPSNTLTLYARVSNGFNPITLTNLHKGGAVIDMEFLDEAEPAGITYVTPTGAATGTVSQEDFDTLQQQVTDLTDQVVAGLTSLTQAIQSM